MGRPPAGFPMPYFANAYIEPKLFYSIVVLGISNFVMLVVLAVVLSSDSTTIESGAVATCREISPFSIDGSDDEHVCEDVTRNCKVGTANARCLDDPTACLAVMTSGSSEDNQQSSCYFTPATVNAAGQSTAPNPLQQLTCQDHDQRAGDQPFPCPLTPGRPSELSTAPILRSDAASVICSPSSTHSCSEDICCTELPPPMTCSDTNGNGVTGESGDLFDCRAEWRSTPESPPVISSYNVDPTAPCHRNAGGCTPYDCCVIPPGLVETHDTTAEAYPGVAVRCCLVCTGTVVMLRQLAPAGGIILRRLGHKKYNHDGLPCC